jgi:hypothetical protein
MCLITRCPKDRDPRLDPHSVASASHDAEEVEVSGGAHAPSTLVGAESGLGELDGGLSPDGLGAGTFPDGTTATSTAAPSHAAAGSALYLFDPDAIDDPNIAQVLGDSSLLSMHLLFLSCLIIISYVSLLRAGQASVPAAQQRRHRSCHRIRHPLRQG